MRRLKCTIQYDGTGYAGYQVQPNGLTIQEVIETTLARMHKHPVKVIGSGRTDARVHAYGQVIHFDTELAIPPENVVKALNTLLPADIRVRSCEEVEPTFEARYDVVGKEYRYFVAAKKMRFVGIYRFISRIRSISSASVKGWHISSVRTTSVRSVCEDGNG